MKLDAPAAVGVPEITPVTAFKVSPGGKLPADTLNIYDPLPPVVVMVCEYGVPSIAFGSVAGLTVIAALMVTL